MVGQDVDSKDKKDKRGSFKISEELHAYIKTRQHDQYKRTGKTPSADEVLLAAVEVEKAVRKKARKPLAFDDLESDNRTLSPEVREILNMVIFVMESGQKRYIDGLSKSVRIFYGYCQEEAAEEDEDPQSNQ